jgi:hypothetical protein
MSMNSFARSEVRLTMEEGDETDDGLELGEIEYSPRSPSGASEASDDISYTKKNLPGEEA